MSRFFGWWIGLGIIATLVTHAVTLAVFRRVDVTFTQFAILLVAPAAQSAVLLWPAGLVTQLGAAIRSAWHHRLASPVLVLDGVLVVAGVILWSSSVLGYGAPVTIQPTWVAVKAVAAACVCAVLTRGLTRVGRGVVCVVLLIVAGHAQFDVLEWMFAQLDKRAVVVPEVFLRLGWYGGLYSAATLALLRVGRAWNEDARVWISTAIALSVPAVLLVLLSMFNHPGVLPPWRGLAILCASAAVTAMMLGVLTTSPHRGDRA